MAELFRVTSHPSANVIELMVPDMIDPLEFDQLNEGMLRALETAKSRLWVLDLTKARYLGSAMLGLIVNVRQRVKSSGGKLILCGMSSELTEIFRTCSMERLFTIVGTSRDALNALAS